MTNALSINERLAKHNTGLKITSGIAPGGGVNRVGIRNGYWSLIGSDGETINITERYLDVILLVGNPNMSKVYYEGAFTGEDGIAPTCHSHNGVGPSVSAAKPQASTCNECILNQWNTAKRSDGTPGKGKACGDRKLIAIIATKHPGKTYKLDIPPASLQNLFAYVQEIMKLGHASGRPMEPFDFVSRLEFDPTKTGQVITFKRGGQLTDPQLVYIADVLDSGQVEGLLELHDKPRAALPAPKAAPQVEAPKQRQAPAAAPSGQGPAALHAAPQTFTPPTGASASAADRIAAARAAQGQAASTVQADMAGGGFEAPAPLPGELDAMLQGAGFTFPG